MKSEENRATVRQVDAEPAASRRRGGDFIVRLVCLLTAFIIWMYAMQVDSPDFTETFYSVDVKLTNTAVLESSGGLSVYSGYGATVDVTVVGKKSTVNKLTGEDIHVTADLSALKEAGLHNVPIHVDLPADLSLSSVSAGTVQVYVDEKSSTVVPIRAKITSFTIENQLQMGELEPAFDTVVVTGPKNALAEIDHAQVTFSLGNVTASMTATGQLVLVDTNGMKIDNPYLRLARTEVSVDIPVYMSKTLPLAVGYKHGYFNETNVSVTVNPATLTVRGDPAVLATMTEIIVATLDEKNIAGDITQQVPLSLPDSLTVPAGVEYVLVQVKHVDTHTKRFTITDIDVTGAVGIDFEILTPSLDVTVRGTLQQLADLKTSDLMAVVDLSGYTKDSSGIITKSATILIDSADAKDVYEIGEYLVQVKLN